MRITRQDRRMNRLMFFVLSRTRAIRDIAKFFKVTPGYVRRVVTMYTDDPLRLKRAQDLGGLHF